MRGYLTLLPEEMDALIGLSHEAFRLYVYLRQFMQRSSGEAFGRGVSWPEIASQGLYLAPRSGVQGTGRPDDRKMHRVRDELIRAGALENVGDHKTHLRFRFPIFIQNRDAYFSVQKQAAPIPQVYAAPIPQVEKPIDSVVYAGIDQQAAGGENAQAAPYTDIHIQVNKQEGAEQVYGKPFPMHKDWKPSAAIEERAKVCRNYELTGKDKALYEQALADVRVFWAFDRPHERRTQSQWEKAVIDKMIYLQSQPPAKPLPAAKVVPIKSTQADSHAGGHPSYKSWDEVKREQGISTPATKQSGWKSITELLG